MASGVQIGSLAVGTSVYANVNGVRTEFLIVHQGNPDTSIYDASCDGTWLLSKNSCGDNQKWNSTKSNSYSASDIRKYLENTLFSLIDANIQSAIKKAKIPYRAGEGSGKTVTSGANGLSTSVFLLSSTEVGFSHSYMPTNEGAVLSYFNGCVADGADSRRAIDGPTSGSYANWYLRSPYCSSSTGSERVIYVDGNNGDYYSTYPTVSLYIRPAFIVDSSALVDTSDYSILGLPSKKHKTLIGGTGYEIKGGRTLVGGTGYSISKGRTLVGGTGYDIPFTVKLGDLPVGTSVYLKENGVSVEYLIVNQGKPSNSTLYDDSCNGTWLLRKNIYSTSKMNSERIGTYGDTDLRYYLNTTFYNLFNATAKSAIINAKIPYNSGSKIYSGTSGTSVYAFLLSYREMGCTRTASSSTTTPEVGAKLSYFDADPSGSYTSSPKRIAYLNGTASEWWSRDANSNATAFYYMGTGGRPENTSNATYTKGVRPAIIMNGETLVSPSDYSIIGL